MTRRKDPEPQAEPPQGMPPVEDTVAAPFVVTDPVDPPPAEPVAAPDLPPPHVILRRGSVLPPLLGGALAAVAGFALSHFNVLGLRPADTSASFAALDTEVQQVQSRLSGLESTSGDLAALSDRLARLETAPKPEAPDLSRLDAFDRRLAAIEALPSDGAASTAALAAKLAELEQRLGAGPEAASPELQKQLDAALARLDEADAAATARAAEASAARAAAERTAALTALSAKVMSGAPFSAELAALNDPAVAEVLAPHAETGIPTVTQLQTGFPDAARQALRIARETSGDDGWGSRLLDFLAGQTEARPLTPLEGSTPEAILSRADFALTEGRVSDAVSELQPLDASVKAALQPWLDAAQVHLSASAALQAAGGE